MNKWQPRRASQSPPPFSRSLAALTTSRRDGARSERHASSTTTNKAMAQMVRLVACERNSLSLKRRLNLVSFDQIIDENSELLRPPPNAGAAVVAAMPHQHLLMQQLLLQQQDSGAASVLGLQQQQQQHAALMAAAVMAARAASPAVASGFSRQQPLPAALGGVGPSSGLQGASRVQSVANAASPYIALSPPQASQRFSSAATQVGTESARSLLCTCFEAPAGEAHHLSSSPLHHLAAATAARVLDRPSSSAVTAIR